jgi:glutathione synthase/RimK-type ligase-like ATP-grasp enzyme
MSHPAAVWQCEYKPLQLSIAVEAGLAIPRTLISSDPLAIRKAFGDFHRMAVKPTRTGHLVHEGQEYSIFTSQVLEEHLDQLDSARYSPAIYQELVPKKHDLRITIVGRQVFSAAIDSQSDPAAVIDWRRTANPHLPHHAVTLPDQLQSRLLRFMDLAGLTFGAIDMIETPDNDYVFLEVNPSGQWLWIDDVLGLGISDALADWLGGRTAP